MNGHNGSNKTHDSFEERGIGPLVENAALVWKYQFAFHFIGTLFHYRHILVATEIGIIITSLCVGRINYELSDGVKITVIVLMIEIIIIIIVK